MHDYNRFKENNQTSDTRRKPSDSQRGNPPNQYDRVPSTMCDLPVNLSLIQRLPLLQNDNFSKCAI